MKDTVVINREDLEELKEAFNYLMEENKTLKEEIEAATKPEELNIDLSGFREMFVVPPDEDEDLKEDDEPELIEDDNELGAIINRVG